MWYFTCCWFVTIYKKNDGKIIYVAKLDKNHVDWESRICNCFCVLLYNILYYIIRLNIYVNTYVKCTHLYDSGNNWKRRGKDLLTFLDQYNRPRRGVNRLSFVERCGQWRRRQYANNNTKLVLRRDGFVFCLLSSRNSLHSRSLVN